MTLQNPQPILEKIDLKEYDAMRKWKNESLPEPTYVEPKISQNNTPKPQIKSESKTINLEEKISGRIQRFGDNVDTDSLIPTEKCHSHLSKEEVARGAFCYTRPEFYDRSQAGATIVVGEKSFGCGSSREVAPRALIWAGIKAVIAKSFAFIYQRNQVNNGLLGIKIQDEEFYQLAQEGAEITIDVENRQIHIGGKTFPFVLDAIQQQLLAEGGLISTYEKYGPELFSMLQSLAEQSKKQKTKASTEW